MSRKARFARQYRQNARERMAELRAQRRALGVCIWCASAACDCRQKHLAAMAARRADRKARGLCPDCPEQTGGSMCEQCLDVRAVKKHHRSADRQRECA